MQETLRPTLTTGLAQLGLDPALATPLLDYLAANAVQQRPCSADAQAGILALSTCAGAETNGRVVVFGWLHPVEKGDEMQ